MGMAVMLTIQPGYMGNDNKKVYGAESTKADSFYLPSANANGVIGATMPYTRYDTEKEKFSNIIASGKYEVVYNVDGLITIYKRTSN